MKSSGKAAEQKQVDLSSVLSRRIYTLHEIVLRLEFATNQEQILTIVRQKARLVLDFDAGVVGIYNNTRSHYTLHSLTQLAELDESQLQLLPAQDEIFGRAVDSYSTVVVELDKHNTKNSFLTQILITVGMKTILVVPLKTGNASIGFISFCSKKRNMFPEEDIGISQLFALYTATALKTMMLLENTHKQMSQIELINSIARKLSTILNREELIQTAAEIIHKSFGYYDVTIFGFTEDRNQLVLEAHAGNFKDFVPNEFRQPASQGITGWVAGNGETLQSNDTSTESRFHAYAHHKTLSELALPIKIENQVIGVLNIEDVKPYAFDTSDAVVLETLCDYLSSIIKNAKLYDEVRAMNTKLTELDKMKSDFLGIVSHDFRNPLSNIMLSGKFLLKDEVVQGSSKIKEQVQLMVNQATRLNTLAEDTLSIARIESGKLDYHYKIVNMERLVEEAISFVKHSPRHKLSSMVDFNATFIKADQSKVRQVVQNLVSNAIKYSPDGGNVTIVVKDLSPEEVMVSVQDEGLGIPADQQDKLFKKFYRVDEERSKKISGTGLGLWICKEVVQAHGGKIWFESEAEKGTTFKFTLKKSQ